MTTASLVKILKQDVSYDEELKNSFHKESKKVLKKLADKLGLKKGEYDILSNKGGIAGSGEISLHTDKLYIQIWQGFNHNEMLYRTCKSRKDYTGGTNQYIHVQKLLDDEFVNRLLSLS